jgi:hypothetical protein
MRRRWWFRNYDNLCHAKRSQGREILRFSRPGERGGHDLEVGRVTTVLGAKALEHLNPLSGFRRRQVEAIPSVTPLRDSC